MKRHVTAAIDIGTDKITVLIAGQDEGGLRLLGAASVRSQGVRKSEIVALEDVVKSINLAVDAAERMAGTNITSAMISLSGRHIESQNSTGVVAVADPNGDITHHDIDRVLEAARAISLPATREIIHALPTSFKVDAQDGIRDPIGMSGVRLEANAHIITGSSTVMRILRKCVEQLGITVQGFVFAGLASANAVLTETDKELGAVVLEIGAGSTALAVYVESMLVHSAVIPMGASNVTKDLAVGARLTIPSAEKVKMALSSEPVDDPPAKESREEARKRLKALDTLDLAELGIHEDIRTLSRRAVYDSFIAPRLKEIFEHTRLSLAEAGLTESVPAGVILSGGGSLTFGAIDLARKTLNLPARIADPAGVGGLLDELRTPAYAVPLGLIIMSAGQVPAEKERAPWLPKGNSLVDQALSLLKRFLP